MKILKCLKNTFRLSNNKISNLNIAENNTDLPRAISNEENIARFIFSPMNISNDGKPKPNCLKPPTGYDEISVNRFDYTSQDFLKNKGLEMQQNPNRNFHGLAIMKAQTIRDNTFEIIYTPIEKDNPFHSDIKIGYIVEKEIPLPAEINAKIREIIKNTTLFVDNDSSTSKWVGEEIKFK